MVYLSTDSENCHSCLKHTNDLFLFCLRVFKAIFFSIEYPDRICSVQGRYIVVAVTQASEEGYGVIACLRKEEQIRVSKQVVVHIVAQFNCKV